VNTGAIIFTTPEQKDYVISLGFSPNGQFMATGNSGLDAVAKIWDTGAITATRVITTLVGHGNDITSVAFSPNGKCLVTSSDDRTAIIWAVPDGTRLRTLAGHTRELYSASWSADGRYIVTASKDGTARAWDAATGDEREILRGHRSWVTSASFSPHDDRIATSSTDGTARQYIASLDELLAQAKQRVTRPFTDGELKAYLITPREVSLTGWDAGSSGGFLCASTNR
jgi:WD40 repeat protein